MLNAEESKAQPSAPTYEPRAKITTRQNDNPPRKSLTIPLLGRVATLASPLPIQIQHGSIENLRCHHVRVDVAGWSSVLEIPLPILRGLIRDPHGCAAIGHTVGEFIDGRGLVGTRQSLVVALTVQRDVLHVLLRHVVQHGLHDGLVGVVLLPHALRGIVRVAPRPVPVPGDRLRIPGHRHIMALTDSQHDVTGHPHMIARIDPHARTDLVLPLPRHHLRVCP
mmetsp:Transcript_1175/g.2271  ORF Transcript_1175/g.2271 Transcript_1175/m.2271 type:complete len:223 (+) Transcript_1175:79-747(+)